jgi:AAA+ ATPase superfamily predicted ATPase
MSSQAEFKPIPNPYIVGNPIKSAEMFYGRQEEFEFTKRKIQSGDKSYVIVFCGERRSGKTSILFQILSGQLGDIFLPVLIDMQTMAGLDNDRDFFGEIAQEICRTLKDSRIDIHDYTFHAFNESPYKSFKALLDRILALHPDKHLVLMIDEYEMMEQKFEGGSLSPDIIPFFAGLLESERRLSFIFTGSHHLEQSKKIEYWRLLFGKSLYRRVGFLSRKDTRRLITEPVQRFVTFDESTVEAIYRLTAGQPFYTQVLCQNVVDHLNECRKNRVTQTDLDAVTEDIVRNPLPQMIYVWDSLGTLEKLAMSALAELQHKKEVFIPVAKMLRFLQQKDSGFRPSRKELTAALEHLYERELASKKDNAYRIQIELLSRWIRQEHSFWRIIQEIGSTQLAPQAETTRRRRLAKRVYLLAVFAVIVLSIVLAKSGLFKSRIEKPAVTQSPPKEEISPPIVTEGEKVRAEAAQTNMRLMKKKADELNALSVAEETYQSAITREERAKSAFAQGKYDEATNSFNIAAGFYEIAAKAAKAAVETKQKLPVETEPMPNEERVADAARDSVVEKRLAAKLAFAEKYAKADFQKGTEAEEKGNQARERKNYALARDYYKAAEGYFEQARQASIEFAEVGKEIDNIKNQLAQAKNEIGATEPEKDEKRGDEEARAGNFAAALGYYKTAYNLYLRRANLINAMSFIRIPGGTFVMGNKGERLDEQPPHEVRLNDFQIAKFEVTNAQYAAFLNVQGNQTEGNSPWIDLSKPDGQIEKVGDKFQAKGGGLKIIP